MLIDNILLNCRLYDHQKSCIILHDISDHFASLTILENALAKKKGPKKSQYDRLTTVKLNP